MGKFIGFIIILIAVLIASFIYAGLAVWLWGAIVVPVFGVPVVTYWQMYGLILFLRVINPLNTSIFKENK